MGNKFQTLAQDFQSRDRQFAFVPSELETVLSRQFHYPS